MNTGFQRDSRKYHSRMNRAPALRMASRLLLPLIIAAGICARAVAGPPHSGLNGGEYAFVLTTDYYSAAYYSTIEVVPPRATQVSISSVHTDAVAHYDYAENMVFVVNRLGADNIQLVDPESGFATVGQYSIGNGSNPHDIRLAGSKAYVTRYEYKTLLICDPYTGDSLGVIDLSPVADSDGIPEMDRMEIVDDRLFIVLNSINHFSWLPDGPGKIAVVDVAADTLIDCDPDAAGVQPILLNLPNPYTELRYDPCRGELVVGCIGVWGVMDGGVEAVDPYNLQSKGVVTTEYNLGGDIGDALLPVSSCGYAVVMDSVPWPDNFARLVSFDRYTGDVLDTLFIQTSGYGSALGGIEVNRQRELYLCDRDATVPGVRVYDQFSGTQLAFRDVGVPPFDIAFVQQAHARAVHPPAGSGAVPAVAIHISPNPAHPFTSISLGSPGPASAAVSGIPANELCIYDARGRLVRTLLSGAGGAAHLEVTWDGRDDRGRPVSSGVYYCRVQWRAETAAGTILLIR